MPMNLTLKNVPDEVYDRLRVSAERNRRSLNSEAIVCLAAVLMPSSINPQERLARVRELRAELRDVWLTDAAVDRAKREGRP